MDAPVIRRAFFQRTRVQIIIAFFIATLCAAAMLMFLPAVMQGTAITLPKFSWIVDFFIIPLAALFSLFVPFILFVWAVEAEIAPGYGLPLRMFTNIYCLFSVGLAFLVLACFYLVHLTLKSVALRIAAFAFLFLIWMWCGAYLCSQYIIN